MDLWLWLQSQYQHWNFCEHQYCCFLCSHHFGHCHLSLLTWVRLSNWGQLAPFLWNFFEPILKIKNFNVSSKVRSRSPCLIHLLAAFKSCCMSSWDKIQSYSYSYLFFSLYFEVEVITVCGEVVSLFSFQFQLAPVSVSNDPNGVIHITKTKSDHATYVRTQLKLFTLFGTSFSLRHTYIWMTNIFLHLIVVVLLWKPASHFMSHALRSILTT